jgi:hypothetical protein
MFLSIICIRFVRFAELLAAGCAKRERYREVPINRENNFFI